MHKAFMWAAVILIFLSALFIISGCGNNSSTSSHTHQPGCGCQEEERVQAEIIKKQIIPEEHDQTYYVEAKVNGQIRGFKATSSSVYGRLEEGKTYEIQIYYGLCNEDYVNQVDGFPTNPE